MKCALVGYRVGVPVDTCQSRDGELLPRASAVVESVEVPLLPELVTDHMEEIVGE